MTLPSRFGPKIDALGFHDVELGPLLAIVENLGWLNNGVKDEEKRAVLLEYVIEVANKSLGSKDEFGDLS